MSLANSDLDKPDILCLANLGLTTKSLHPDFCCYGQTSILAYAVVADLLSSARSDSNDMWRYIWESDPAIGRLSPRFVARTTSDTPSDDMSNLPDYFAVESHTFKSTTVSTANIYHILIPNKS